MIVQIEVTKLQDREVLAILSKRMFWLAEPPASPFSLVCGEEVIELIVLQILYDDDAEDILLICQYGCNKEEESQELVRHLLKHGFVNIVDEEQE